MKMRTAEERTFLFLLDCLDKSAAENSVAREKDEKHSQNGGNYGTGIIICVICNRY